MGKTNAMKKRNLEGYGLKIKKYRKEAGMTADTLADELQVNVSSIRNWECGLSRPDPEYLYKMFTILNVDPNEFFGIKGIGESLTDNEKNVISLFRSMDIRGQDDYMAIGEAISTRCHILKLKETKEKIVSLSDYGRYAAAGTGDGWSQVNETEEVLLYAIGPVSKADEVITVSGHSMEPYYNDQDRILVRHCTDIEIGETYIFNVRGLGIVIKEAEEDRLHSLNPEYDDIIPSEDYEAELIGQVIGIIDSSMYPTKQDLELYQEALTTLKD